MANYKSNRKPARKPRPSAGVGGITPIKIEPRCPVCTSPYRRRIEELLVLGLPYINIETFFGDMDDYKVSRHSVANHHKKHMDVEEAAIRSIIEDRARQIGIDPNETKEFLLTKRSLLEVMVHKGYKAVMDGTVLVEPEQLLKLVGKLEELENEHHQAQVDEIMRDFELFSMAVKTVVPEDMWSEITKKFEDNMAVHARKTVVFDELPVITGEVVN